MQRIKKLFPKHQTNLFQVIVLGHCNYDYKNILAQLRILSTRLLKVNSEEMPDTEIEKVGLFLKQTNITNHLEKKF